MRPALLFTALLLFAPAGAAAQSDAEPSTPPSESPTAPATETETETDTAPDPEPDSATDSDPDPDADSAAGSDSAADSEAEPEEELTHDERLFGIGQGSALSSALGVSTLVATVGALAGVIVLVTAQDQLDGCDALEASEPLEFGCVNRPEIAEQRDVGLGVTLALGAVALGLGVAWLVVALGEGDEPEAPRAACAPGLLGVACAGRF